MAQKFDMYNFDQEQKSKTMAGSITNPLIEFRNKALKELLSDFEGSAHKLEYVKSIRGVDFINDSRATNSNSVWFALESMTKPTVWIMNISDLKDITGNLMESINKHVKKIVIQGVYDSEMIDFFTILQMDVAFAMNLEDAVRIAFYSCESEETVLFSPGVVSGGMYRTYRERGNKFKEAVAQL